MTASSSPPTPSSVPRFWPYAGFFLLGALVIAALVYRLYEGERRDLEDRLSGELREIASLKAAQVAAWRSERVGDARVIVADVVLMPALQRLLAGQPLSDSNASIGVWADAFRSSYRYSSLLITDPSGRIVLTSGTPLGTPDDYSAVARQALAARQLIFTGRTDPTGRHPHFVVAAAIAGLAIPSGVAILDIDPATTLYPVTLQWPRPSASGEILLVQQAGDAALYLSNERRTGRGALVVRDSLTRGNSPAVRAVRGDAALAESRTRDGSNVVSTSAPVPDSPWFVVADLDETEAYQPLRRGLTLDLLGAGGVLFVLGAGLGLVWRSQVTAFYRQRYEAETERRALVGRFDAELRTSRERLALALEAANEGHWEWDRDHQSTYVSPRYHDMLGYGPGEVLPGHDALRTMTHPDDVDTLDRAFESVAAPGQNVYSVEVRVRQKSGEYIWVSNRGKAIARDAAGVPTRIVGTQADITSRRDLEEQLRQSQKLESIGRLAGGVAHDFNNLLTVINGYSELLIGRLDRRELREPLEQIRKAGDRAASLTQQLLAFSRRQVTQPRPMSLNALVGESAQMLSRLIGENIQLVIRANAQPDVVVADPGQIHQVLVNLVVNSRDAMPDGGTLTVETTNVDGSPASGGGTGEEPPGPHIVLLVADTGSGMDEGTIQQIFDPFFTTKPAGHGTGLGLSTVYGIVQQSNGAIRVTSVPGQGTVIGVYLPQANASALAEMPERPLTSLQGSETILVVEDQHDVRSFVTMSLRSYGYRVLEAANAADAIALIEGVREPIDLLVTDVVMPTMNGRELAERMKPTRQKLGVLFMSGYSDAVLGERGIIDPSVAYIQKPFGPAELAARVRTLLNRFDVPQTVLVVDDEEAIRTLLLELLRPLGCDVLLAGDGGEALDLVSQHGAIDLVITDLVMPEQEGLETIRALRRRWPTMKIIAMSGAFGGQFLQMSRLLGADAILTKPIHAFKLQDALRQLFAEKAES